MRSGTVQNKHGLTQRIFRCAAVVFASVSCISAGELMKKGDELYRSEKYAEAIPVYMQALKAEENPPITHFNIGNCWFQLDSLPRAAVHYEAVLRQAPEFLRAYLNLGISYFNMNQFGNAAAVLERGRLEDPENLTMIQVLAESYRKLKKYDKAVPLLLETVERDSTKIDTWFTLADISRELGDADEASGYLKRYPDSGRRKADKYFLLAETAEKNEKFSEAVFYLNQYASLNPSDKWPHFKIIGIMKKQGNPLSAVFKAQETMKKFPAFSDAALLGGNIAFAEKQFRLAEDLYLKAYRNGSAGGVTGLTNCGKIYAKTGDRTGSDRIARLLAEKQKK